MFTQEQARNTRDSRQYSKIGIAKLSSMNESVSFQFFCESGKYHYMPMPCFQIIPYLIFITVSFKIEPNAEVKYLE